MLRLSWILGFVSTQVYEARERRERLGPGAAPPTDAVLQRLEKALAQDRLAIVLLFLGMLILTYTFFHGPLLQQ